MTNEIATREDTFPKFLAIKHKGKFNFHGPYDTQEGVDRAKWYLENVQRKVVVVLDEMEVPKEVRERRG
jgi:hypothetical protein